jgi:hypothetical protein
MMNGNRNIKLKRKSMCYGNIAYSYGENIGKDFPVVMQRCGA